MRLPASVLLALTLCTWGVTAHAAAQPDPQPASPAPEGKAGATKQFFRGLGKTLEQATGITLVRSGEKASASGDARLYEPLGGGDSFEGIFTHGDRDLALQGRLEWPRVALTFIEYGSNLPCWTVEARIWTSAAASTTERFRTCLGALWTRTDDLGNKVTYDKRDPLSRAKLRRFLDLQPLYGYVDTTGTTRTTGPNPPRHLFGVNVPSQLEEKVDDAALNAMWISGFINPEDSSMKSSFFDWRIWIAGFDPAGNRDR